MLKDKLTQAEKKTETKIFLSNEQPQYIHFKTLWDHLEYKRNRKEWTYAASHAEELKLNREAKELLEMKGNKNAKEEIEWIQSEIDFNLKHIKGAK